jgi:hypothetical protein
MLGDWWLACGLAWYMRGSELALHARICSWSACLVSMHQILIGLIFRYRYYILDESKWPPHMHKWIQSIVDHIRSIRMLWYKYRRLGNIICPCMSYPLWFLACRRVINSFPRWWNNTSKADPLPEEVAFFSSTRILASEVRVGFTGVRPWFSVSGSLVSLLSLRYLWSKSSSGLSTRGVMEVG